MKKTPFLFLILFLLLFSGCGQTNYFEWTKGASSESDIAKAQTYVDEGSYTKAISLLADHVAKNPADKEAGLIYAQALMGRAGAELANVISKISADTPTPSMMKLDLIVDNEKRGDILAAADILLKFTLTDPSDQAIAAICGLVAAAEIISKTFDPDNDDLMNDSGEFTATDNVSVTWTGLGGKQNDYLSLAVDNIIKLSGDKNLSDAATSMKTVFATANAAATANTLTWEDLKSGILSF